MTPFSGTVCSYSRRVWIQYPPLVLVLLLGVGCAATPPSKGLTTIHTSREVVADWNDVDAAVEVALHQVQMAMDHTEASSDELEKRFPLWTVTDEPATLTIRREAIGQESQRLTLEASVGRFGDPARESRLIHAVRHRLKSLAGKTHAPVTEP
jgi:hypothetical protein